MLGIRNVFHVLGLVACWIGCMLLIPAVVDLLFHNVDWHHFAGSAAIALFAGATIAAATRHPNVFQFTFRQAFLMISLSWAVVALLGALPFLSYGLSFTDAIFETISGITTTGSTVLTGLDDLPPGMLLWRALLQWMGGIGIIAIAVLIMPVLKVGGMQFFKIEASGTPNEQTVLTIRMLSNLAGVYLGLTLLCGMAFYALGMNAFDAATHAMATLSTGGYSTHDASFGYFQELPLQWVATVFMACGAIPFLLHIKVTQGDWKVFFTDQQVRGFLLFLLATGLAMGLWLSYRQDMGLERAMTLAFFNITSVVTTTGFASSDYTMWGSGAIGCFLILMFVGGCSGSTSGAIKIYRYQVIWLFVRAYVRKLYSPHRVVVLEYNGRPLDAEVPLGVLAFLTVFIATIAFFTAVLTFMDLDLTTAYSASVTAITNVGPGIGQLIGPSSTFHDLPDAAKWVLGAAMLAGRLEVLAVLVLFDPDFWLE